MSVPSRFYLARGRWAVWQNRPELRVFVKVWGPVFRKWGIVFVKRAPVLLVVVTLLVGGVTTAQAKSRSDECRYAGANGRRGLQRPEVKATIRCAGHKWRVPTGTDMALCIARRESRFFVRAQNPYSSAAGVYQVVSGTWHSWRYEHLRRFSHRWELSTRVLDGRANVMVSVRVMDRWGLSPWGGGC